MKRVNYIIGIDPGFSKTGVAVLSIDLTTQEIKNVFTFFIHTNSLETDNIRIMSIMHQLYYILLFYWKNTQCIFVEQIFFNKNITSSHKVSQVVRLIKLLSENYFSISVIEITPLSIKKYITGNGRSNKQQVRNNLLLKFNINTFLSIKELQKDEIDAIACGIAGWKTKII